jgi:hypothetical protein
MSERIEPLGPDELDAALAFLARTDLGPGDLEAIELLRQRAVAALAARGVAPEGVVGEDDTLIP